MSNNNKFHIGDYVRVIRKWENNEFNVQLYPPLNINEIIGKVGKIIDMYDDYCDVKFSEPINDWWKFPYFVLEIAITSTSSNKRNTMINEVMEAPSHQFLPGKTLFHFKGGVYKSLGMVMLTSSKYKIDEPCVHYIKIQNADGSYVNDVIEYVRPISEFEDMMHGSDYGMDFNEQKRFSTKPFKEDK